MSEARAIAQRAKSELTQLAATFDELSAELLREIGDSKPEELTKREALYHQFNALGRVRERLQFKASALVVEETRDLLAEAGFSR